VHWDFQLKGQTYKRQQNADGTFAKEYNWVWSPQGVINMHQPETWGYVYFSSQAPGKSDEFSVSDDEKIKWKLYEFYRAQKAFFKENKSWYKSIKDSNMNWLVDDKLLQPELEYHGTGWNMSVISPFSNNLLIIREDGKLYSK